MNRVTFRLSEADEELIRAIGSHFNLELEVIERVAESVGNERDIPEDDGRRRRSTLIVPRDTNALECEYCLCQPCVLSSKQSWMGNGQSPCKQNAGIRKSRYKNFWTLLDRRGAWRDERYLEKKETLMRRDGVVTMVVTRREMMPSCVVQKVRSMYPNPPNQRYIGHRWIWVNRVIFHTHTKRPFSGPPHSPKENYRIPQTKFFHFYLYETDFSSIFYDYLHHCWSRNDNCCYSASSWLV